MKKTKIFFLLGSLSFLLGSTCFAQTTTTLVAAGTSWKYLANGSNQGTAWQGTGFSDAAWVSGNAQLGYGDGDEATVVSYGPSSTAKYTTTYFRKTITVADASIFTSYTLNVRRDDGVVIYINGVEKYRNNMPTGAIAYNTWASTACSDDGAAFLAPVSLTSGSLITGTNVIAVEIHQNAGSSSDISFDLSLIGNSTAADVTAPLVSTYSPADNATNVANSANLVLTFSENIQKGTGNILVKEGGVITQTIAVTAASVTVSGNTVTIDPANFTYSAAANIEIAAGVFKDMSNNNYAGITVATTWNFTVQATPPVGNQTLVTTGSSWKYLDNGSNQGTAWTGTGFSDAAWASGNAELGYGDGGEATVVSYGPSSTAKYITTYFRKTISVADASIFLNYSLNVKRDDGIVVYINGVEKYRNNMPTGAIAYNTAASTACSDDGAAFLATVSLAAGSVITGTNVIAVEIHQNAGSSSDISFDFELIGNTSGGGGGGGTAALTRGPYLQMGTSSSIIVRWRSDVATDTKVSYGLTSTALTSNVTNASLVTNHEIQLSGLTPNTKYFYSIGSTSQTLQGDANNFFTTAPVIGTEQKVRVWVSGDCGNNSTNQTNVRNQYHNYIGTNNTDVWLLLGDNAYSNGLDNEYQSNFYNIYKDKMLKQTVLWPAPGNHDYANSATKQNDHAIPYYDMFSLPTAAQVGGVASGTEAYYSYNYGNVHFIALDSYGKESSAYRLYDTLGPQAVWVKQDLAANTQKWTIVYWHHPPYTMGSHNSDSESELVSMRQNFIKILERYKVDLILCGHSHSYERSKLMKGHFGNEASFVAGTHHLSTSSAKYDGTASSCPYIKNASTNYNGTVYVVAGSAGQLGGTQASFPHSAMYYSNATNGGSMALEIEENRLTSKWVCADGIIRDQFTIVKDVNKTTNINITSGQNVVLTASWVGNYSWTPGGATTRSITVAPTSNTSYTVTDGVSCLSDIYNITVAPAMPPISGDGSRAPDMASIEEDFLSLKVYPNPFSAQTTIEYNTPFVGNVTLDIFNIKGDLVKSLAAGTIDNGKYTYDFDAKKEEIKPGIYFVSLTFGEQRVSQKIVVIND